MSIKPEIQPKGQDEMKKKNQKFVLVEEDSPPASPKLVVTKDTSDEKTKSQIPSLNLGNAVYASAVMHRMLQANNRKKSGGNKKWTYRSFDADTVIRYQTAGATGTFYANVISLQPNNQTAVTEAAALATLFDEQKCKGITVHCRVASNLGVIAGAWSLVYDVANAAPYTSVAGTLIAGQVLGPVSFNYAFGTTSESKTGYQIKRFRPPTELAATATTGNPNETVGGQWFASQDQNATVGYLKFAVDVITGGAIQPDLFIVYHMQYRERS